MNKTIAAVIVILCLAAVFWAVRLYTDGQTTDTAMGEGPAQSVTLPGPLPDNQEVRMLEPPNGSAARREPKAAPGKEEAELLRDVDRYEHTPSKLVGNKDFFTNGPAESEEEFCASLFSSDTEKELRLSNAAKKRLRRASDSYLKELKRIYSQWPKALKDRDVQTQIVLMQAKTAADEEFDSLCQKALSGKQYQKLSEIVKNNTIFMAPGANKKDLEFSKAYDEAMKKGEEVVVVESGDPFNPFKLITKKEFDRIVREHEAAAKSGASGDKAAAAN